MRATLQGLIKGGDVAKAGSGPEWLSHGCLVPPGGLERAQRCVVPAVPTPAPTGVSPRWMLGSEPAVTVTAAHGACVSTRHLLGITS